MPARITGERELAQFLDAFPKKLRNGAVRAGIRQGAKVIEAEAKLQVADTTATGELRNGIKTGSAKVEQNGNVTIRVRVTGKHAFLAPMIEHGVSRHLIARDDGKGVLKIGSDFVTGKVEHPGFPAKPFMRPALDIAEGRAIAAIGAKIREYMKSKTSFTAPVTLDVEDD